MIPKRETQDEEIKMQILIAPTAGFEIPKPGTYRARIIEITEHPALNEDWGHHCRVDQGSTGSTRQ